MEYNSRFIKHTGAPGTDPEKKRRKKSGKKKEEEENVLWPVIKHFHFLILRYLLGEISLFGNIYWVKNVLCSPTGLITGHGTFVEQYLYGSVC